VQTIEVNQTGKRVEFRHWVWQETFLTA
jgi:hypothetical protein